MLSREFSRRIGDDHSCIHLPVVGWLDKAGEQIEESSLPYLLYHAFQSETGKRLLELDRGNALVTCLPVILLNEVIKLSETENIGT